MSRSVVAGVLVGGAATRMGGRPKGLMLSPEGTAIVERWRSMLRDLDVPVVLVGTHAAYGPLQMVALEDDPPGIGPLGGIVALLRHAGGARALALACDMPFVTRALVERLLAPGDAPAVAPRRGGRWEPLFAIYDAPRVLPIALARVAKGAHSLQGLLDEAGTVALPLTPVEADELRDWDTPEDLKTSPPGPLSAGGEGEQP